MMIVITEGDIRGELTERLSPRAVDRAWGYLCDEGQVASVVGGERDVRWLEDRVIRFLMAINRKDLLTEKPPTLAAPYAKIAERAVARSVLLARDAEQWPGVHAFRKDLLKGKLLAPAGVEQWIEDRAKPDGDATKYVELALPRATRVEHVGGARYRLRPRLPAEVSVSGFSARALTYAAPDSPWVRRCPTAIGGTLDSLRVLAESLERKCGWPSGAGATFILTGQVPLVGPLRIQHVLSFGTASSHVMLDVDPAAVSPRLLAQEYAAILRRLRGPRRRHRVMSPKHLQLAVFAAERGDVESWADRQKAWNRAHPTWRYTDERLFRRDAAHARRRLLASDETGTLLSTDEPVAATGAARSQAPKPRRARGTSRQRPTKRPVAGGTSTRKSSSVRPAHSRSC